MNLEQLRLPTPRFFSFATIVAGVVFGYLVQSEVDPTQEVHWWFMFLISYGPWLLATIILLRTKQSVGLAITTILMLGVEMFCYYVTYTDPDNASGSLVYLIKPFVQVFICLPLGFMSPRIYSAMNK